MRLNAGTAEPSNQLAERCSCSKQGPATTGYMIARNGTITRQPILRDLHNAHQTIVDATLQRDADRAAAILAQHIGMTYDAVKQLPPELFNRQMS
jgi:DNA-binding FadR family transcriptional regulator